MSALAPQHDLLVRAALSEDPAAGTAAYEHWRGQVVVDDLDGPALQLLPHLIERFAEDAREDPVAERLRRIVRFTFLSTHQLFGRTLPLLNALLEAGIPAVAIKGAAVLHHAGVTPGLRPMGDLDVLVPVSRIPDAAAVLAPLGLSSFRPLPGDPSDPLLQSAFGSNLQDGKGASLDLHWHLLRCSRHPSADDGFIERARPGKVREFECPILSPEDTLLNVIEHGAREAALRWTLDATLLLRGCELDWDLVVRTAHEHRQAAPVGEALSYLVDSVGVPVPRRQLDQLRRARPTAAQWDARRRRRKPLEDGRPSLPGATGRAIESWDEHAALALPPGRRAGPVEGVRWLRSMWLLDRAAAVPAHAAFVALRRPWWLRRLMGGHRRAAARHRELPPYRSGTLLEFGEGLGGAPYAVAGWDVMEADHAWTRGGLGRLVLPLADSPGGEWQLEAGCGVLLSPVRDTAEVDLIVGGRRVASWEFALGEEPEWLTAELPAPAPGPLEVLFRVRHPAIPVNLRYPQGDWRQLGMHLNRLRLGPKSADLLSLDSPAQ